MLFRSGGFPGIPLAILFPEVKFHLVDSIGKKVRVATEVANAIGLKNVTFRHARAEEEKQLFDFVVSRAVMPLADLVKIIKKNISPKQQNPLPNGLICLKGGELEHEAMPFKHKTTMHPLSDDFEEEFFQTKKVVYGLIGKGAVEAIGRQPSAAGEIRTSMLIMGALVEGVALFAIVVCFLALFQ